MNGSFDYLQYIIGVILKPFDTFKKDEEKLNDVKNLGILSAIVVGIMVIVSLLQSMISAVRVTSFWSKEVKWVFGNLKEVEYFKVIGQSLLIYAGIIVAIAAVYFFVSIAKKKQVNFIKLLGATVTSFIPFVLAAGILSPILSMIYSPLGICITVVGVVYTLIMLLELMNELIRIEDINSKIYFHVTSLSIAIMVCGFIAYKLILGSLSSGYGALLNLF